MILSNIVDISLIPARCVTRCLFERYQIAGVLDDTCFCGNVDDLEPSVPIAEKPRRATEECEAFCPGSPSHSCGYGGAYLGGADATVVKYVMNVWETGYGETNCGLI